PAAPAAGALRRAHRPEADRLPRVRVARRPRARARAARGDRLPGVALPRRARARPADGAEGVVFRHALPHGVRAPGARGRVPFRPGDTSGAPALLEEGAPRA